uniref:Glycosomal membrane protein n=1 Tax=Trypanosoma congolense (strain IL3000) TaxID=1068625 RepID=G0UX36_TRYCI|nr:conserved hypothetical protein [Trypanosoma congolense IL3000]
MSLINCRMLANHFRYPASFSVALSTIRAREGPTFHWLLISACFLLRTFEQMTGDLNYYQMTIMRHWSRSRLSHKYWFFKSLSLTCLLLDEVLQLVTTVRSPEWKKKSPEERSLHIKRKAISVIRCLLDMSVYYRWVSWYNPYKTLQYCSMTISGLLGVFVGWGDVCSAADALEALRIEDAKKF